MENIPLYPLFTKHPRISDFGTINSRTAEIQLYFVGGRDLVNQPLSARFAMQAFPNSILRFIKVELLLNERRDEIYLR